MEKLDEFLEYQVNQSSNFDEDDDEEEDEDEEDINEIINY